MCQANCLNGRATGVSPRGHRRRPRSAARFYKEARAKGDFENGIEMAVRAVLASTEFLFRIERDPKNVAAARLPRERRRARVATLVLPVEQRARR